MRHARGRLTIDLAALQENYKIIQKTLAPGCVSAAVVKADAYGLGAVEVVRALIGVGCDTFFVASLAEALELRAAHKNCRILVLNGFFESAADTYIDQNIMPVLGSFIEIEGCKRLAGKTGAPLPVFLHFNTRMNRLGFGSIETREMLGNMSMLDELDIQGVMSHFACADEAGHEMNDLQYNLFKDIAEHFPDVPKSLCNSSGIFRSADYHFDLVRPGMALYGLNPTPEKDNPMRPVVSLDLPVIRTRIVQDGASVGYGATYRFDSEAQLATVSAGYADGIHWAQSNSGAFYWKGHRCPIRGRVSMDMTTVDLSDVPKGERPKPGDYMEVLGPNQSPADFGATGGSFDYEVLTALGNRYKRDYINA